MPAFRRLAAVLAVFVAAVALALVPTSAALAALPPGPASTNIATDEISDLFRPGEEGGQLVRSARVRLDEGFYTYGQLYNTSMTHDRTGVYLPAGTYELFDMLSDTWDTSRTIDGEPIRMHASWLDPVDGADPIPGGVIITGRAIPATTETMDWGWMLLPEPAE
ncbi:hypothetical protein [Pseudonocardia sp. HH130630-07]|uniref:hypothetical protein n=1 Tax=Pseudonocardia sp. HH130630-07 TaxID=1690815 RepID=UPI000814EC8A|nr:hypothetical protein [Pseudonocardia sp. HH130630-07]ANY07743.1 hypothetical protein AFB00_17205 [Pseudonocardia sp. HH130630-07]